MEICLISYFFMKSITSPYNKGYITKEELLKTAEELKKTDYGQYLFNLVKDD